MYHNAIIIFLYHLSAKIQNGNICKDQEDAQCQCLFKMVFFVVVFCHLKHDEKMLHQHFICKFFYKIHWSTEMFLSQTLKHQFGLSAFSIKVSLLPVTKYSRRIISMDISITCHSLLLLSSITLHT